jgi:excisionase family DNA binding protein
MNLKLTDEHLRRRAIVYVRQSTPAQLLHNRESQRRQYGLADYARSLGFQDVETIDDDLGRTASGCVERPGFQRLVAEVCAGQIGAVFCIEASRLARNGKDWHHLIELCGLVNALVIDPEGMYDPHLINDRLLLGLKGTMSEFELNLFRQRSVEAIRQKAQRGELQFTLPVGLCWTAHGKIEIDPDLRVQQAIRAVLQRFQELGSARQAHMAFQAESMLMPTLGTDSTGPCINWKPPSYYNILSVVSNPMYAGAYAFGKTEVRTSVVDGQARKSDGHQKSRDNWTVLITDHHPGYITWEQFERNQLLLSENAYMKSRMGRKSGRGGRSLLAGLLRCGRCGRMMVIRYSGHDGNTPFFRCRARTYYGLKGCPSFNGWRADQAISNELLQALEGPAVEAALEAAKHVEQQDTAWREALALERQQAEYEARLAQRRYEAVDPDNRLVASELETRWNSALARVRELQLKMEKSESAGRTALGVDKQALLALAEDLPVVWNAPETDMKLKQRIARILIQEIAVNFDEEASETVFIIHWNGGRHSELRVRKNRTGHHNRATKAEAVDVIRQMSGRYPDDQIAATLNRLGFRTGFGHAWTKARIQNLRNKLELPACNLNGCTRTVLTLEQAAERLSMNRATVKRLIEEKILPATQIIPGAPWEIPEESIQLPAVLEAAKRMAARPRIPRTKNQEGQEYLFSNT